MKLRVAPIQSGNSKAVLGTTKSKPGYWPKPNCGCHKTSMASRRKTPSPRKPSVPRTGSDTVFRVSPTGRSDILPAMKDAVPTTKEEQLLAALRELKDVKAALDEH